MTVPHLDHESAERVLGRTVDSLVTRFDGVFGAETVDRYVRESYQALYRTAAVKQYVPLLAGRFAEERLVALAQASGALAKPVPEVVFVCTQNSGRSQMAAALLRAAGAGRVHVRSAGSRPGERIEPLVETALAEIDVLLEGEFPKPLTDDVVRAADVVVTMGCGDACPVYPGKRYLDWHVEDPAGQDLEAVRRIRDDIRDRVDALLAALAAPALAAADEAVAAGRPDRPAPAHREDLA
jgi:arsenate reductase